MQTAADPDDDLTDEEIEAASAEGDALFDEVADRLSQGVEDPDGVAYWLWCNLTRYLAEAGWSSEELAKDAAHHAADQGAEGRA